MAANSWNEGWQATPTKHTTVELIFKHRETGDLKPHTVPLLEYHKQIARLIPIMIDGGYSLFKFVGSDGREYEVMEDSEEQK